MFPVMREIVGTWNHSRRNFGAPGHFHYRRWGVRRIRPSALDHDGLVSSSPFPTPLLLPHPRTCLPPPLLPRHTAVGPVQGPRKMHTLAVRPRVRANVASKARSILSSEPFRGCSSEPLSGHCGVCWQWSYTKANDSNGPTQNECCYDCVLFLLSSPTARMRTGTTADMMIVRRRVEPRRLA